MNACMSHLIITSKTTNMMTTVTTTIIVVASAPAATGRADEMAFKTKYVVLICTYRLVLSNHKFNYHNYVVHTIT